MQGTVTTSILNFRATPEQRDTIHWAARRCGLTLSDFMREAALERAKLMQAKGTT